MTTKIVDADGRTLAELGSVQIAGPVGRMGTRFVATGDDRVMELAMNPRALQMVHRGNTYNCLVQGSQMESNASGTGFAIHGQVWQRT